MFWQPAAHDSIVRVQSLLPPQSGHYLLERKIIQLLVSVFIYKTTILQVYIGTAWGSNSREPLLVKFVHMQRQDSTVMAAAQVGQNQLPWGTHSRGGFRK